jgi:hypothetical protein
MIAVTGNGSATARSRPGITGFPSPQLGKLERGAQISTFLGKRVEQRRQVTRYPELLSTRHTVLHPSGCGFQRGAILSLGL